VIVTVIISSAIFKSLQVEGICICHRPSGYLPQASSRIPGVGSSAHMPLYNEGSGILIVGALVGEANALKIQPCNVAKTLGVAWELRIELTIHLFIETPKQVHSRVISGDLPMQSSRSRRFLIILSMDDIMVS